MAGKSNKAADKLDNKFEYNALRTNDAFQSILPQAIQHFHH